MFQDLLQHGQLQSATGVFDIGALPNLPGLAAMARKPKAKAKAKGKGKAKARKPIQNQDNDVRSFFALTFYRYIEVLNNQ